MSRHSRRPKPARLRLNALEDRTVPAGSIGPFQAVSHSGSLVYEATGGGSLGLVVASDGFESGALGSAWSTYSSSATGRIQVSGAFGTASGTGALLMDSTASGPYNLNEAVWTVDLSGRSDATLRFSHAVFNDEPEGFAGPFSGHFDADGVAVSNDGVNWQPVFSAPAFFGGWQRESIDLRAALAGTGVSLNDPTFFVKFQQYDNFPLDTDGRGWDDVAIVGAGGPADMIELTVDGGQEIRVIVDGEGSLRPRASLIGPNRGAVLATATAAAPGGEAVLPPVVVPGRISETNPGPVTYQLKIEGIATTTPRPVTRNLGDYRVRVVLNADLDQEDHGGAANNTQGTAQSLAGNFIAVNRAGTVPPGPRDPARAAVLGTTDSSPSSGFVDEVEVNNPAPVVLPPVLDSAQDIDVGGWSLDDNPNFIAPTEIPHLQVDATGDGTFDYFKFTVDADFSFGLFYLNDPSFSMLGVVFDSTGLDVAYFDAFGFYYGDLFTAGEYYIGIGTYNVSILAGQLVGEAPAAGQDYSILMSVLDHATNPDGDDPLAEVEPNHPDLPEAPPPVLTDFAQDLDGETWVLNTDPAVTAGNTVPHVRVLATGDGSFDYYSFTVPAGGGRAIVGLRDDQFFSGFGYGLLTVFDATGAAVGFGSSFGEFDGVLPGGEYVVGVGGAPSGTFNGQLVGTAPQDGDSYTLNVSVVGHAYEPPTPDVYSVPMLSGEVLSVALTGLVPGAPIQVELLAPNGTVVATGDAAPTNVGVAIASFAVPVPANTHPGSTAAVYSVRVKPEIAGAPYNLVVTRGAVGELEGNETLATAQALPASPPGGGRRWLTGSLENTVQSITATDSGWWNGGGEHESFNTNYVTGLIEGVEYRSFYVFDTSGINGTVVSAALQAYNPGIAVDFGDGYISPDPTETFTLFDVTTPVAQLTAGGVGQTAIFDDLGAGPTYGSYVASPADNGQFVTVPLNAAGLALVQGGGPVAFGGVLTTLGGADVELLFGYSGGVAPTLDVTTRDADFYKITVPADYTLQIDTATPAGGAGAFVNTFDPMLKLYDSAGVLVASNDNGSADGRNALVNYTVTAGGTYYIQVLSSPLTAAPTEGEYVLSVLDTPIRGGSSGTGGGDGRTAGRAALRKVNALAAKDRGKLKGDAGGDGLALSADGLYTSHVTAARPVGPVAVSYTHLTLPTICSV